MTKNQNTNKENNTFEVKQRTFSITTADSDKNILRTGYIGPCVAFYGRHKGTKTVFMSHVDGNILGYKKLEQQLKNLTNEELDGFSLYATTNYSITLRIIIILLFFLSIFIFQDKILPALLFIISIFFCFGSLIQVYIFSKLKFKAANFQLQTRCQISGRISVSIDAKSDNLPIPIEDTLPTKESKILYEPPPKHCWFEGQRENY